MKALWLVSPIRSGSLWRKTLCCCLVSTHLYLKWWIPYFGDLCDNYRATLQSLWKVFRQMFFSVNTDVCGELAEEVFFWRPLPESHICAGVTEQVEQWSIAPESARASWTSFTRSDLLCQQFSSSPWDLNLTSSVSASRHFLITMWSEETQNTLCYVATALPCFVGIIHFRVLGHSLEETVAAGCWDEMKEVLVFIKLWN